MSQMMEDTLRYDIAQYRKRIAELEAEINQKADYNMQAFERIAELEFPWQ